MPTPDRPRRERLRTELAQLRLRSGIGGRGMGKLIGASQGTVYRIEHGETLPSIPHVRRWLDAVADAGVEVDRDRLLDLAEAVHAETRGWSELLGDVGHAQDEAFDIETAARRARIYQPTVVPGLLQTPEYARALFAIGRTTDITGALARRMERQQRLYEPGRKFVFLLAEQVLRWPLGGTEVLAAQADRIVSLSRLDAVEIAVVPASATVAAVWHNFILWDFEDEPTRVTAELIDGEHDSSKEESVALFEQVWSRLWDVAATGDDAIALIQDPR
jgi:transcriptional regulator with XRE-family HTH domain